MKTVDINKLKECANKLMFNLSDEQYETLLSEFDIIGKQMDLIGNIKGVDDVKPMTFPFEVTNSFLREDIPSKPVAVDEALKNATDVVDGQIRLPKVVG